MRAKDRIPGLRVSVVREPGPAHGAAGLDASSASVVASIAAHFIPEGDEREHFLVVCLDARRRVRGVAVVSIGTMSASLVHPREVFRPAIVAGAAGIVVVHNHPSGDPHPSSEDRDVTRRLQRAGEVVGIPVVDHVVVAAGCQKFSFREAGLL